MRLLSCQVSRIGANSMGKVNGLHLRVRRADRDVGGRRGPGSAAHARSAASTVSGVEPAGLERLAEVGQRGLVVGGGVLHQGDLLLSGNRSVGQPVEHAGQLVGGRQGSGRRHRRARACQSSDAGSAAAAGGVRRHSPPSPSAATRVTALRTAAGVRCTGSAQLTTTAGPVRTASRSASRSGWDPRRRSPARSWWRRCSRWP